MIASSLLESLYFEALAKPEEARAAYLDHVCGTDGELRRLLERMLVAQPRIEGFLERPAIAPDGHSETHDLTGHREGPGTVMGRYRLLEEIGAGGMGTVWTAQQTEPVRRIVAVKLIRAGMDTRSVLARFDAERQALALMDHPNIAKVLDGGTTGELPNEPPALAGGVRSAPPAPPAYAGGSPRPYFVMEFVKGIPITDYCDEHHLTPRQCIELFIPVCQAIQHAHQKGIIHRDIKPSNVLVAIYDDRPVPKVIDFGVAKAIGNN
jgi:serine/threonine protein kinase